MTDDRSLSPAAEACLCRPYPSSQKGGTLIAEDVLDLATHERRLEDPDTYRPSACPRCGAALHIHDLRPRVLHGEASVATEVVRFRCADRERCGAAWQVLPAFLARCLWGSWTRIGQTLEANAAASAPVRTRRRWRARLASPARWLVAVLSTATDALWAGIARAMGLDARRIDLVRGYAERTAAVAVSWATRLAELSAALHRLSPGVRLM